MKKIFLFASAIIMLTACSSQDGEDFNVQSSMFNETTEVTMTFSPYDVEPLTRTTTSIADVVTHLDVWLVEGENVTDLHQSSSDVGFGSVSVTLNKTKTYTLYAVAHKCASDATLTDGVIAFPDDKVTHSMYYTTTFSPSTTNNLSCLMQRIVADFRLEITDDFPVACKSVRFTVAGVFDRWSVTTGATHSINRVSTISYGGTSSIFNVYAIVTDAQTTHDIQVEALDNGGNVLQTRTFTAVPLRNGYKTTYTGVYFTDTPTAAAFTVTDWEEFAAVNF